MIDELCPNNRANRAKYNVPPGQVNGLLLFMVYLLYQYVKGFKSSLVKVEASYIDRQKTTAVRGSRKVLSPGKLCVCR